MLVEIMSFLESFIICSAILLIIYAADIFIRKKKYYYIKTVLLCIISVICYQATIPFFIALVVILLIIKNKDNYKRILKDILNSIIIVGVAAFVNILIVNITTAILNTSQMRIGFNIDLLTHNIIYIFKNISWIFINQCNLYFNGLFLFIIIGIIVSILSSERENKRKHVINIFLILFVTIFVNFAMHVPTISAYYTGRTKYAIGSIIGLLFIYMYLRTNIFDNNDWIRKFTTLIIIMYISSNIICAIMQTTYIKQVNKLERKTALQIEQYIREYEEKNSLKINKIGIINIYNQQEKAYYDEINTKSFLAIDAIRCNWSVAGAINFYTNRNLEKVELTTDEKLKYLTCFKDEKSYTCFENMLLVKTYMY